MEKDKFHRIKKYPKDRLVWDVETEIKEHLENLERIKSELNWIADKSDCSWTRRRLWDLKREISRATVWWRNSIKDEQSKKGGI